MYVEFLKNFLLDDSSKHMAVRLISASWDQKLWILRFKHDVRRLRVKFSSRRFEQAHAC